MIKRFQIYGERCSGTNLINALMSGNSMHHKNKIGSFPELKPTSHFGHKHWIGHNTKRIIEEGDDTLFIGIVRNPYDWIMSFRRQLYHVPPELQNIRNFLNNTWYSIENGKEVIWDRFWKTGDRFSSIFELREEKLKYLYFVMPKIAKNYIFITYEELCSDTDSFIGKVAEKTGLKSRPHNLNIKLKTYNVPLGIVDKVNSSVNWTLENLVGYEKKLNGTT